MIDSFIKKYSNGGKSLLELACGTGVVARELLNRGYDVIGIDLSEDMLAEASDNIGDDRVSLADMRDFNLNRKFDIVLCNYNSVCHLIDIKDWRKLFNRAYEHLNDGGVLIFDINTIYEFECISSDYAQFFNFIDPDTNRMDVVCLEMFKKSKPANLSNIKSKEEYYYEWLIKMFVQAEDNRYDLFEEIIAENSFEIEEIKKELTSFGFSVLKVEDFHKGYIDDESERVYFIAKKTG